MSIPLPPPLRSPLFGANGVLTLEWQRYFQSISLTGQSTAEQITTTTEAIEQVQGQLGNETAPHPPYDDSELRRASAGWDTPRPYDDSEIRNALSSAEPVRNLRIEAELDELKGKIAALVEGPGSLSIQQQLDELRVLIASADCPNFSNQGSSGGSVSTGNLTESTSDVLTITGGTNAVVGSGTSIQVSQASSSQDGYLSKSDWTAFNEAGILNAIPNQLNLQQQLDELRFLIASLREFPRAGDLSEATSSILTITNGAGAVVGNGTTIQVAQASGSQSGYLSSTDWSTFNNKQAALTLPLAITNGGTGQSTPSAALTALGGASLTANNTLTGSQTINNATGLVIENGSGVIEAVIVGSSGNAAFGGQSSPRGNVSVGSNLDLNTSTSLTANSVQQIRADTSGNLVLDAHGSGAIYFNWDNSGTGGVVFGTGGNGVQAASVNSSGVASFAGVGSSGAITGTLGGYSAWTPTITAGGSMTVSSVSTLIAQYIRIGPLVLFELWVTFTLGGTASTTVLVSLPVSAISGNHAALTGICLNGGASAYTGGFAVPGSSLTTYLSGQSNWTLGAAGIQISGQYRVA